MRTITIAAYIHNCLWTVKPEGTALLDVHVLWFCSVHALIELADIQAYLVKDLERAFLEDPGSTIALYEEVAAH